MTTKLRGGRQKTKATSITIKLPADTEEALSVLTKISGKTKDDLIKKFIDEGAEDMADTIIVKEELEAIRTGKSKLHTWEEAGLDF